MDNRVEPGTRLADEASATAAPEPDAAAKQTAVVKPGLAGSRSGGNGTEQTAGSAPAAGAKPSVSGTLPPAPADDGNSQAGNGDRGADWTRSAGASASGTPVSSQTVPRLIGTGMPSTDPTRTVGTPFPGLAAARPAGPVSGMPGSGATGFAPPVPAASPQPSGFPAPASAASPQPSGFSSAPRTGQGDLLGVPSGDAKSKVRAPFGTLTKKKPKPTKTGRPGSAIKTGNAATAPAKAGSQSRPAARLAPTGAGQDGAQARDAQLVVSRVEPWSVMKFSFMVSLVGWVVLFVAVAALYYAFSSLGVFHQIEQTIGTVTSTKNNAGTNGASWFSASTVLGYTMLAGAIDVLLITALATVAAVVYNLVTHLSGGIEVTLREAD